MSMVFLILGVSSIYVGTLLLFRKRYESEVSELKNLIASLREEIHQSSVINRKLEIDLSLLNTKTQLKAMDKGVENKIVKKRGRRPGWNRNK